MPVLRLFAAAREAAGEARLEIGGGTVGEVLDEARRRYGESFTAVLERSRVWVNGQPAEDSAALREQDVVAVLPPVSGGSGAPGAPAPPGGATLPEPPPARAPQRPAVPARPPDPASGPPEAPAPAEPLSTRASLDDETRAWLFESEPRSPAAEVRPRPAVAEPPPAGARPAPSPPPPPAAAPPPPPPPTPSSPPSPPPPSGAGGSSPDDLLDRLAGLPPWPEESWYSDAPLPPLPSAPAPPNHPQDTGDDSLWGPGSGPVWSVGDRGRRSGPRRDRADWAEASPPPEPPAPPPDERDRIEWDTPLVSPPDEHPPDASPFAPRRPGEAIPDDDRRWDDVLTPDRPGAPGRPSPGTDFDLRPPPPEPREPPPEGAGAGSTEASAGPPQPGAPPGSIGARWTPGLAGPDLDDEPAVRILGPEPFHRPAGGAVPDTPAPLAVAPVPGGSTLVRERRAPPPAPVRAPTAATTAAATTAAAAATTAAAATAAAAATTAAAAAVQPQRLLSPAPATKAPPRTRPPLAVVPKSTRPHGRLGLLWLVVSVVALVWSDVTAGAWFALCAGLAGFQTAKVWKARNEKPLLSVAAGIAAVLPLGAIAGPRAMTAAAVVAVVVTLLARTVVQTKAPARDVGLTLAIGVVIGLAAASVVLLRTMGLHAPLLLLAFAAAYDVGAYLVGTGASSAWEGPAAGIATMIPVTMLSAVILVPPFPEGAPLLLGLLAAILAPCGPLAGSVLLGERDANAPVLRRLDSLLVMAPIWAWVAAAFLR